METTDAAREANKPARLVSLDAFRGLTIFLMLLVNNVALGRLTPETLKHADWENRVHLADLVFPWFLFCVGVALPFSVASLRAREPSRWRRTQRVLGRVVALLLLGMLLDSAIAKQPVIGLGVLQLIGLAYGVGAAVYALPMLARLGLAAALLVGYGIALNAFGPITADSNLVRHLSDTYLRSVFLAGLPSLVPTAAMVLIASAVGDWMRREQPLQSRAIGLAIGGALFTLVGWLSSQGIPFNKPIWTPPYILYCAGLATLAILAFHLATDVPRWTAWAYPLLVFGSNAILAYVLPILVKVMILREWTFIEGGPSLQQAWLGSAVDRWGLWQGGWLYTFGYIAAWWLVLWIFYRKRIFLRV